MLLFAALSPMMAVSTYIEDRRSGRKGFERRSREYHALLAEARDELEAERRAELRRRHEALPSAVELLRRARTLDPQLWERRPGDPDFLELRLGVGTGPALLAPAGRPRRQRGAPAGGRVGRSSGTRRSRRCR